MQAYKTIEKGFKRHHYYQFIIIYKLLEMTTNLCLMLQQTKSSWHRNHNTAWQDMGSSI